MDTDRPQPRSATAGPHRRVLVVDDDELARAGLLATLEHRGAGLAVEGRSVADVLAARAADLLGVEAVVVEAVDPTRTDDQVIGAIVADHLRRVGPAELRIVVVCGLAADDAVRRRVAEAGADRYVHRSWARRGEDLVRAVVADDAPDLVVPPLRDPDAAERLGIGPATRVNAGVLAALAEQLVPSDGVVSGQERYARRVRFNQVARLRPVTADGSDPARLELVPSIRQIQRFHAWAALVAGRPADGPRRIEVTCGAGAGDER